MLKRDSDRGSTKKNAYGVGSSQGSLRKPQFGAPNVNPATRRSLAHGTQEDQGALGTGADATARNQTMLQGSRMQRDEDGHARR